MLLTSIKTRLAGLLFHFRCKQGFRKSLISNVYEVLYIPSSMLGTSTSYFTLLSYLILEQPSGVSSSIIPFYRWGNRLRRIKWLAWGHTIRKCLGLESNRDLFNSRSAPKFSLCLRVEFEIKKHSSSWWKEKKLEEI